MALDLRGLNPAPVTPFTTDGDIDFAAIQRLGSWLGSIEGVKSLVVLGHAQCGGIRAFAEGRAPLSPSDFIGRWMSLVEPAATALGAYDASDLTELEQAAIKGTLENLMTFPYIRRAAEAGALTLHGAYFGVANGKLSVRDPATGTFSTV